MQRLLQLANDRPQGPSWSPYLAVGMCVLFGLVALGLYTRDRRRRRGK
ncbi:hypothetical protein ABZT08_26655 [Streptomyces sp. NPDC005526]